ncbi:MAG TPA: AbrB family transcriptional regulator [Chloroflexota bacterium]|nr:AbrB family transcriptional regulator [Chloroflexota bacterium]
MIEKEIRDRLGVQPGSVAIQRLVGDHVEIRFASPPPRLTLHNRSLLGVLSSSSETVPPDRLGQARKRAWAGAAQEEERAWRESRTSNNRKSRDGGPRR